MPSQQSDFAHLAHRTDRARSARRADRDSRPVEDELDRAFADLAELGLRAGAGSSCSIAYERGGVKKIARALSAPARWGPIEAIIAARAGDTSRQDGSNGTRVGVEVSASELDYLCASNGIESEGAIALVVRGEARDCWIASVMIANASAERCESILSLINAQAIATLDRERFKTEIVRLRNRASEISQRETASAKKFEREATETAQIEKAIQRLMGINPARTGAKGRMAQIARLAAGFAKSDAWLIVRLAGKSPAIETSHGFESFAIKGRSSAILDCLSRRTVIRRDDVAAGRRLYEEDLIVKRAGLRSFVCFPLGERAILIASGEPFGFDLIERFIERAAPIARCSELEERIEEMGALNDTLAARLFTAIDAERAQIARDLHDDQAQMIAAAKIALSARPAQAAEIFKRIEESLRERVRALRPARLGKMTLEGAIARQTEQLNVASIRTKVAIGKGVAAIRRGLQQVIYQMVREAASNIIRHAHATQVTISVERRDGIVRVEVADNGKGMEGNGSACGIGLMGMNERMTAMGGRLEILSRCGATRVIGELPDARDLSSR